MEKRIGIGFLILAFVVIAGCRRFRPETGFDAAHAMTMFYGNFDQNMQTSTVSLSATGPSETANQLMTVHPLFQSFAGNGGNENYVLLTYALPQNAGEFDCHACAPTIGMAVFAKKGMKWTMTAANRAVTELGGFGKPPGDIGLIQIGSGHQGIKIVDSDTGNGETTSALFILAPWNGTVNLALERIVADDNAGGCAPDGNLPCYSNHRSVRFVPDAKVDYYRVELSLSGTDLPLNDKRMNHARVVGGDEELKFDDGKYVQVSRRGDLTYVDLAVKGREGLK